MSQRARKRIEEILCWAKTVGGQRKTHYRDTAPKTASRPPAGATAR
jgi:hypothetical protein